MGCDIHSADRIVPEWQSIDVGSEVKLAAEIGLVVAGLERGQALVLRGGIPMGTAPAPYDFSWAFVLIDKYDGTTRLVVRERYGYSRRWAPLLVEPVELISFVMGRRMLRGIKQRVERTAAGHATPIERASPADLVLLAMDSGSAVPEHLGAVLVLDAGPTFEVEAARRMLAERIRAVPRLRQRLVRLPPGLGRPVWVDDPGFDAARHVRVRQCPGPGDEQSLLDLAAAVAAEPLPRSRPLWAAVVVPGLAGGRVGLVIVLHHVLADGIGGLAILARLVDGAGLGPGKGVPAAAPDARPAGRRRDPIPAVCARPVPRGVA